MALLGNGGILELSREWPEPMALAQSAINYTSTPQRINLGNTNYWTGDRVLLHFPEGSPFAASNPPGSGVYFGSIWALSAARQHVTAPNANYYQADNSVYFYDNGVVLYSIDGYINIDELGRIRVFSTELAAHNLDTSKELVINAASTGNFVLTRYSNNSSYTTAVANAANQIKPLTLPSDTQLLKDVITVPSGFALVSEDPAQRGWLFQADLQEWALDIDAANLDMTAIGETFGENTKALVRGAGSLQFLLDHKTTSSGQDSLAMLRLVLLTQQGCKSTAKFWLYKNRSSNCGQISGSVYYLCELLLTNSRINTRADQIIAGSSDFVITGEIAVKIDS